ncbi:Rieske 2Fe-2S domain-containing protein [Turneriella parva]|uniref:Rieske (2Fe-2S) iron-sulfur domain-containing protein n=1 Tax=Turneriella parva (strain ATCC BAA-1111 / DSM 21527 / NCTC 11395 / H) TaxID=869212 RepID=I4BAP9_TURPD|nr:Rieske 2Fe-2S domain-containing protein [Turneriella parva]AFM14356.1 Rieske (2Fe-2S) iron-sulfur domain-containing protein [Turneriella parva DSM 21527]
MSKALDYLLKARPDAMQAYFTFLKKAGEHLDPKTAALISVITKVHAKTANGVRQYLPRALKAGATADEVIDALLMAMPALGFSKIVWAIDVIIEMNLPEFAHVGKPATPSSATETWHEVAPLASLQEGDAKYFQAGARKAILTLNSGKIVVYDAHCPHKGNAIPESGIAEGSIVCPFHEWKFDLKSGECTAGGNKPLTVLPSKIENGIVLVKG